MKKRNKYRILSILFCFMFLFFVGCDGGPGGSSGEEGDIPRSLNGVKVLSKPADYDFGQAVGSYASKYYYNLFAGEVLRQLYKSYEDLTIVDDGNLLLLDALSGAENFYIDKDTATETYTLNENKFYFYDSIRYTIQSIETVREKNADGTSGKVIKQKLVLDLNSGWDWGIGYQPSGYLDNAASIIFVKSADANVSVVPENDKLKVDFNKNFYASTNTSWTNIYTPTTTLPEFMDTYVPDLPEIENKDGVDIHKYNISPFIQKEILKQNDITAFNYYQDALEYAVYLFVLGYDYADENGTATEDAPLFDFTVDFGTDGIVRDIKVGGWEAQPISIVDALKRVTSLYEELGNYVGITDKNKVQIQRFVKDKVIGADAYAKNSFEISRMNYVQNASTPNVNEVDNSNPADTINFDRNYDIVIEKSIEYACKKAPIGNSLENGVNTPLSLDNPYVTSKITDYKGDYFFMSYENEDDSEMFKYIEAAEYQSLALYPQLVDLNKPITDLWLAFEYYEDPNPSAGLVFADSITINVGFRYFNSSANGGAGEYTFMGEAPITIDYGKNGSFEGADPDKHWFFICDFSDVANVYLDKDVTINTLFNNNIGGGVINPFAGDTSIDEKKSKLITGTNEARNYYKLNDSSTYGAFGSLNENMFSTSSAGEEHCDFMEVYFDTVKQKGVSGINYNFKVGLVMYLTEEEV